MNTEIIEVKGSIKLGQFLKLSGLAESGAQASALIHDGIVTVDGEVVTARGKHLSTGQIVSLEDEGAPFQAQVKVID